MLDKPPELDALFLAALEIQSPEKRAAFLAQSCGDNVSLRNEVERLLCSHEQVGRFLEQPAPELAASLVAGLAAAFPADAAVVMGAGGHSVFKALGQTVDLPRVVLRESAAEGHDPVVRPMSSEMPDRKSDSRYQVQGEIARGGMGAILKGRDTDLGRDLAIKVLLDEHKDKPDVIQRFVEEAQIGGQLQHPGIAPIYELGQFADKRPFFAMKLVKGETLSKLLADRAESSADRGRFLGVFEQVCQTMAYAHSRGVIHRDLKPANIMVGAFGEVQVMDWGLAKVLSAGGVADEKRSRAIQQGQSVIQTRRSGVGSDPPGSAGSVGSHTHMGSIMGTPAYMPPEQALGEIDNLDERADVFGLGAILCEILTGQPPYVGTDVFRLAARGKLGDCMARLDSCGADADLIALTKHCLELEPKDRPRDANTLAERISGYLQSVETKLRETELAKVDAQVRAEELHRRHKLAFTAGAAIAASLIIGLAVSMWQGVRANREAARAKSEEQRAVAALDELRATAPAFAEQARSLVAKEQFSEAIEKLDYAVNLRPDVAEYLVAKGDLLQCQLKLAEAAANYRQALRVQPGLARAEDSAQLCEELLAAKPGDDGKLTRESLAMLHLALQRQQRPAAEIMPVARLLGEEKKLLVEYWLARLKDLPVSAERPLAERLSVREDGLLALDLSDTKVLDLSPLTGAPIAELDLSKCKELTDLSPLRGLDLVELDISWTKVSDLSALSELRLKSLECRGCPIRDLSPIRRLPLETINLRETRVADLSPLVGMPIKKIELAWTPLQDFSPLAQLPLEECYFEHSRISDLEVLRGKSLKVLCLWGCEDARNYAVLAEMKTLENLQLPATFRDLPVQDYEAIGALRDHPNLRQIGASIMNGMGYAATGSKDVFWQEWDREQALFSALRAQGITFDFRMQPAGTYVLYILDQPLRDLSILKGMPIVELDLHRCPFVDLTPIHDLKLEKLSISSDSVTDFSPLRGMSIKRLFLRGCPHLRDLSPLTELPLRELYLDENKNLTDVAALAEIPTLERVSIPLHARNVEALRKLPKLKLLGFRLNGGGPDSTAEVFWENYDRVRQLLDAGIKPRAWWRLDNGRWDLDLTGADVSNLSSLEGMSIETLGLGKAKVTDLAALRGMPLKSLQLWETPIVDLEPLRGAPLTDLNLARTQVSDLSPLEGMPLLRLNLARTKVADISVLRGMPLVEARFSNCTLLTDVSPLAECKELLTVTLPPNAKDFEFLRAFPKLQRLSFTEDPSNYYRPDKTAAEFWKEYDAKK